MLSQRIFFLFTFIICPVDNSSYTNVSSLSQKITLQIIEGAKS